MQQPLQQSNGAGQGLAGVGSSATVAHSFVNANNP